MPMPNVTPTEFQEAKVFAAWLSTQKVIFSHLAQETFTRSWGIKMKNKISGVHSGVPDYIIITDNGLLFVELKRTKGGVVSDAQRYWIESLNKCAGVQAEVCKGAEQAIEFVKRFL